MQLDFKQFIISQALTKSRKQYHEIYSKILHTNQINIAKQKLFIKKLKNIYQSYQETMRYTKYLIIQK